METGDPKAIAAEVLACLSEKLDPGTLQALLGRRSLKPFHRVSELKSVSGLTQETYNDIFDRLTVSSSRFQIESHAVVRGSIGAVAAEVERSDSETVLLT